MDLYEFIQITPLIGIFVLKDITGTIIGGGLTFEIHKLITMRFNLDNNIIEDDSMNLETNRLTFKKVAKEDANDLFKIFSNKDLTKYFV